MGSIQPGGNRGQTPTALSDGAVTGYSAGALEALAESPEQDPADVGPRDGDMNEQAEPSPIRQALLAARRSRHVSPEPGRPRRDDIDHVVGAGPATHSRPEDASVFEPPETNTGIPTNIDAIDGFELTIEDFGSAWAETVQGWVVDEAGRTHWRPIVTTTEDVPNWEIDTTLGVVTGEAALGLDASRVRDLLREPGGRRLLEQRVHLDRTAAHQAMVESAVARGAHAVVGMSVGYTPIGDVVVITAAGTAVTLRPPHLALEDY